MVMWMKDPKAKSPVKVKGLTTMSGNVSFLSIPVNYFCFSSKTLFPQKVVSV
jgi:hypothetical protein